MLIAEIGGQVDQLADPISCPLVIQRRQIGRQDGLKIVLTSMLFETRYAGAHPASTAREAYSHLLRRRHNPDFVRRCDRHPLISY